MGTLYRHASSKAKQVWCDLDQVDDKKSVCKVCYVCVATNRVSECDLDSECACVTAQLDPTCHTTCVLRLPNRWYLPLQMYEGHQCTATTGSRFTLRSPLGIVRHTITGLLSFCFCDEKMHTPAEWKPQKRILWKKRVKI